MMQALRINKLEIDNYMRVKALKIDADGKHVSITGPNASGKTSVVTAIWEALAGASSKAVPEAVHRGEERASVTLDLGDMIVTRTYTDKSSTLTIRGRDGEKVSRPQELLDGLLSRYSLDPVAFLSRRPQDQVDDVLGVCGVEPPADQVAQLTGEDHAPEPGESADRYLDRLSGDGRGTYYVRRLEAGRTLDQKHKARTEAEQHLDAIGGRPDDDESPSASAITTKLETLYAHREQWQAAQRAVSETINQAEAAKRELAAAEQAVTDGERVVVQIESQIAELTRQRDAKIAENTGNRERAAERRAVVDGAEAAITKARADAAAIADPAPAIAQGQALLRDIDQAQQAIADRQHQARVVDQLVTDEQHASEAHEAAEKLLDALRELRRNLLAGIDLGIDGLAVADGELTLNGVSFRQASGAERLRVACAIAMRQSPRLRLLRIDGGEQLDGDSRAMLFALADAQDFQVVITSVADGGDLVVEVVDDHEPAVAAGASA